ncbi:MAG: hypothetical protein IJX77_02310 [Ruminococcus sp.]|nr:hypothetical protein [Ruminococcus sp.]
MKRIIAALIPFLLLLTGCADLRLLLSDSVDVNDKTYKTGFYGSLIPDELDYSGETYSVGKTEYKQLEHDRFDLIRSDSGMYTSGTIYCSEEQFSEAELYYSDPENFSYYCTIGAESTDNTPYTLNIDDIDTDMFNALIEFADNSSYDPFDSKHNDKIDKAELPIPDNYITHRLNFYKESNDSLFTSSKGHEFHIIDDELYLVFYYDYGHGEYEKLVGVKVPEEISGYIVEYIKPYYK